ncbi:MAG: hypothetical protein U0Z44_19955 [Kouleothrix sp.]
MIAWIAPALIVRLRPLRISLSSADAEVFNDQIGVHSTSSIFTISIDITRHEVPGRSGIQRWDAQLLRLLLGRLNDREVVLRPPHTRMVSPSTICSPSTCSTMRRSIVQTPACSGDIEVWVMVNS